MNFFLSTFRVAIQFIGIIKVHQIRINLKLTDFLDI